MSRCVCGHGDPDTDLPPADHATDCPTNPSKTEDIRPCRCPISSTNMWCTSINCRNNPAPPKIDYTERGPINEGRLWCSICLFLDEPQRPNEWEIAPLTIINGALLCADHVTYEHGANMPLNYARRAIDS
jgi:hypothetical protein